MSRNNNRMGLPDNLVFEEDPTVEPSSPADFSAQDNLGWVTPTEFISLPTQGAFYPEGHPLCNVESIEIKYMTAKEEDILTSESLIKKGIALDRLLQSVMVDKSIPLNDLLVADKNALLIGTRITGYGPAYETNVTCPSCSSVTEYEFNLESRSYEDLDPLSSLRENGVELTEDKTFTVTLPFSGKEIECRFLTGNQHEKIGKVKLKKNRAPSVETNATDLLKSLVLSVGGDTDKFMITAFIKTMPARDARFLRDLIDKITPKAEFTAEFECPSCGEVTDVEVPLSVRFFWPNFKV